MTEEEMLAQLIVILDGAAGVSLEHVINDIEEWMEQGLTMDKSPDTPEDRKWFVDHVREMTS